MKIIDFNAARLEKAEAKELACMQELILEVALPQLTMEEKKEAMKAVLEKDAATLHRLVMPYLRRYQMRLRNE